MKKRIATLLAVALLASGCTTVKEGLVGDEREDIRPFAEATIELLTMAPIDFHKSDLVYLRSHYDSNPEAMARFADILARVDEYRDDIVDYSIELVRISDSYPTDAEKCHALGDVVSERSNGRFVRDDKITAEQYRSAGARLGAMEDFLACLRELQPLIATSGQGFEDLLSEAEEVLLPAAITQLDESISKEYRTVLKQLDVVYERRDELFGGLQAIRRYRKGDKSALQGFNAATMLAGTSYALPASPTEAQLERTKDHLIEQLQKEQEILTLLEVDRDDYIATYLELEKEEQHILKGLELARRQVAAWVQAHQGLANGVRDPGKWLKGLMQVAQAYRQVK